MYPPDAYEASDDVTSESYYDDPGSSAPLPPPDGASPPSRRELLRDAALLGIAASLSPAALSGGSASAQTGTTLVPVLPPLPETSGSPRPWIESQSVYSGVVNLGTGNLLLSLPICGWGGRGGLSFGIVFNSQSTRTSALGAKWAHSYRSFITGTSPAVAVDDDGAETSFTLSGSTYSPPVGVYEALVKNGDGTWTRTLKGGTVMTYLTNGNLDKITDRNGNVTQLAYTGGSLTSVTDATGVRSLTLGYTGGKLTSVTDALGRVWIVNYDASNRVSSINDPSLNNTTYSRGIGYNAAGNVASLRDRKSKIWTYAYNANSANVFYTVTDPDTNLWKLEYLAYSASVGGQLTATGGGAHTTQPNPNPVTTNPFARWTDARTNFTDYAFDDAGLGRTKAVIDPLRNTTRYGWDTANNRTSVTTPSGKVWGYSFDGRGNLTSETDPYNKQTVRTYLNDFLETVSNPLGITTTRYDYSTDGKMNLLKVTNYAYSNNPTGEATTYTYNPDGSTATVTDAEGRKTSYSYDTWGHQNSVKVWKSATAYDETTYVFNKTSQAASRTDARGRTTTYTIDAWGRRTGTTYTTSGRTGITLTLDPNGNVTGAVDGTGTRTFTLDAWGRRTQLVDPMGTTNAAYDPNGNLKTQTDAASRTLRYTYDANNRIATVSEDNNATQAMYAYLPDGGTDTLTYPNGTQAKWTYDDAGRVKTLTHSKTTTVPATVLVSYTTTYDDAGQLRWIAESPSGASTQYGFDSVGRLGFEERIEPARSYQSTYIYDKTGLRKKTITPGSGGTTQEDRYTYGPKGELQAVQNYTLQPGGTEIFNGTEFYSWYSDTSLASYPTKNGYSVLPDYDEEGRLVSLAHKSDSTGAVTLAFEYAYAFDGGRRSKKDGASGVQTWFPCGVACSAGELVELTRPIDPSGNPTGGGAWTLATTYLRGGGCSASVLGKKTSSTTQWWHSDVLGSVSLVTDGSASVKVAQLVDALGVLRFSSTPGAPKQNTAPKIGDDNGDDGLIGFPGTCPALADRALAMTALCFGPPQNGRPKKSPPVDWDCVQRCIPIALGGFGTGCGLALKGSGKLCYAAAIAAISTCILAPEGCGLALSTARVFCGKAINNCISFGIAVAGNSFVACYRGCAGGNP